MLHYIDIKLKNPLFRWCSHFIIIFGFIYWQDIQIMSINSIQFMVIIFLLWISSFELNFTKYKSEWREDNFQTFQRCYRRKRWDDKREATFTSKIDNWSMVGSQGSNPDNFQINFTNTIQEPISILVLEWRLEYEDYLD